MPSPGHRGLRHRSGTDGWGVDFEGLEHGHFDHDGLVDVLMVTLRPLDGLIAMHNTIAPLLGKPPLALVPQPS